LELTTRSNNAIRDSADKKRLPVIYTLAVAEIGGFSLLLAGFFRQLK
jgi:hypothetical protein